MTIDYATTLESLASLQSHSLSIIHLSEPFSSSQSSQRDPDVSASSAIEQPSPASLEVELSHYKDLFSKLRFSYLEQVTKEKFLRSIVGDPPLIVEPAENVELEAQLVEVKAVLKAQKLRVTEMMEELEAKGRDLCRRHENISLQTALLSNLPSEISSLQSTISSLRSQTEGLITNPSASSPSLSLSLPATLSLIDNRQSQLADLDEQLKILQQVLPRKSRELEKLENEVREAERTRETVIRGMGDAISRRKGEDEMEGRGRWLRGVEAGLREMLEV